MAGYRQWTWWLIAAACGVGGAGCSSSDSDDEMASGTRNSAAGGSAVPSYASGGAATSGGIASAGTGSNFSGATADYESGNESASAGASNEGDNYEPVGTNPFVIVGHDPLSTFGADVDTASYDIFRRDIGYGILPDPASVRLEEYVNFFAYDYPAPALDGEHPFSISLAAAPSLFEYDTRILRIGIQGALPPLAEKKPANLVFLVDTSGSMQSAEKLPLVQRVLSGAVDVLEPTDKISIVTYAGSTEVKLQPTAVADAETIKSVIAGLSAAGSTAGAAGIDLAYEQAQAGFIEGGINHVILCTDGDFNVGPYSTPELLELIVEKRKSGVTLTTLGFGIGNLNDAMMEAVSDAGNGIYSVIASSEQADDYVSNKLLSTLVHIAKDMKIQVEFNPAEVYAYRLLGYEDRAIADNDFRNDIVDAGEVGAGHRVTALYELVLNGHELPSVTGAPAPEDGTAYDGVTEVSPDDLVLVKVRYKSPGAAEADPAYEVQNTLAPAAVAETWADLDADFQWALALSSFAEILKDSPYAVPERLPQIETIIQRPAHAEKADRAEFVGLFAQAKGLLAAP